MKKGFTLIELLVVVLIIGILTAVAVPQYQKAVEKARMSEAIILTKAIAAAHQRYYMEHGAYLGPDDMQQLDIEIAGEITDGQRIKTKYFKYSPDGQAGPGVNSGHLALTWRISDTGTELYRIFIDPDDPNRTHCTYNGSANAIQKQLCSQLNDNGF